jgi:DNA-binding MarR family transcriptional regulator
VDCLNRRSHIQAGQPVVDDVQDIPLVRLLSMAVTVALADLHRELNGSGHPTLRSVHGYALNAVINGHTTASAIAPLLAMTKQGASRVVQHLLDERYLEYDTSSTAGDLRSKPLVLTSRGREAVSLSVTVQERIERRWVEVVGEREMSTARRALEDAVRHDRVELPPIRLGW